MHGRQTSFAPDARRVRRVRRSPPRSPRWRCGAGRSTCRGCATSARISRRCRRPRRSPSSCSPPASSPRSAAAGAPRVAACALRALIAGAALADALLGLPLDMGISPAASVALLLLALVTPLPRSARAFGVSLHGTGGGAGRRGGVLRAARPEPARAALRHRRAAARLLRAGRARRDARRDRARRRRGRRRGCSIRSSGGAPARWSRAGCCRRRSSCRSPSAGRACSPSAKALFGEAVGMTLFTTVMIVAFGALILWVAHTLDASRAPARAGRGAGGREPRMAAGDAGGDRRRRDRHRPRRAACASSTPRRSA